MSFFFFTLSEATVAPTPWSYIQGVRYKELGGRSANLSHAGSDYREGAIEREGERWRESVFKAKRDKEARDRGHQLPDFICF